MGENQLTCPAKTFIPFVEATLPRMFWARIETQGL
jgi:hypothetical protein